MAAYGQTNVMEDPNWLLANMAGRGPHDPVRLRMEAALGVLQHRNQMQATEAARQATIQGENTRAALAAREMDERSRQAHLDRVANAQRDEAYRQQIEKGRAAAQRSEDENRVISMLKELPQDKNTAALTTSVINRFLSERGIPTNVAAPQTEADKAIARVGAAQGRTPVTPAGASQGATQQAASASGGPTPTTGVAPTFSPGAELTQPRTMTGYHWTAGTGGLSGGNDAGMQVFYDNGTAEWVPTSIPGQVPPALPPVRRNVEGGQINSEFSKERGIPAGYDFNFSTGRMVPQSDLGTINGVPSAEAVARGGAKLGINPVYSPPAMDILDRARTQASEAVSAGAGKPTLESSPTGVTPESTQFTPGGGAGTVKQFSGPPNAPIPSGFSVGSPADLTKPQTQPQTVGAPTAEPTPNAGAPDQAGAYGMFRHTPLDVLKNIGQNLAPGVFGYPPNTPGVPPVAIQPPKPTPPPPKPQDQGT